MALLLPEIKNPYEIGNPGEHVLAMSLINQLPDEVIVYHSVEYLVLKDKETLKDKKTLEEGECDFVIVDPHNGILVVEVKTGLFEYKMNKGDWRNWGPAKQARKNLYKIVELIKTRLQLETIPFRYAYAVAFPTEQLSGHGAPNMHSEIILDSKKCLKLKEHFQNIFDLRSKKKFERLDKDMMKDIHQALCGHFNIVPVMWQNLEYQENRIFRATKEQKKILEMVPDHNVASFEGVAGSGKTLLAIAKAQAMADAGKRTLLLCYNIALAEWLQQNTKASDNLTIDCFLGLAEPLCEEADEDFKSLDDFEKDEDEYWDEYVPKRLEEALKKLPKEKKFDAIIIDEGQDFKELWWSLIEDLFKDSEKKECYYVFYDPQQNLFVDKVTVPKEILGPSHKLKMNCRNTIAIAKYCSKIIGIKSEFAPYSPFGQEPETQIVSDIGDALEQSDEILKKWTNESNKLNYKDIAVFTLSALEQDQINSKIETPTTTSLEKWRDDKGVLFATWRKYKGLEADAVIVIHITKDGKPKREHEKTADLYVACSRAKHFLEVIEVRT